MICSGKAEALFINKIKAISSIQLGLGDQKIDLVVYDPQGIAMTNIVEQAMNTGVLL